MKAPNLTTVFGGQFGSEGKGEIARYLHAINPYSMGVRVGGPNAGHTFYDKNNGHDPLKRVVQSLPIVAACGGEGVIGPAGVFIVDLLLKELHDAMVLCGHPIRLYIDPRAAIITQEHMERESDMNRRIGSTREGVGAATSDKVMRLPITVGQNPLLMVPLLSDLAGSDVHVVDTVPLVNDRLQSGGRVMIEGTQGYGLSLHTSSMYPFCTSRECTPMGLYAETGINPKNAYYGADEVMVLRTYPIRVAGNSGPMSDEITWDWLKTATNGYVESPEITTVTKKVRRISRFDQAMVARAIQQCRPTILAVTFLDYLYPETAGKNPLNNPATEVSVSLYIHNLEELYKVKVGFVSTGPGSTYSVSHDTMSDILNKEGLV